MNYDKHLIAQRRGSITIIVLSFLQTPKYGYELSKLLEEEGYPVEQSTLYPMLRRLESENILLSQWNESNNRNQKYYSMTKEGFELWKFLCKEWKKTNSIIKELTK